MSAQHPAGNRELPDNPEMESLLSSEKQLDSPQLPFVSVIVPIYKGDVFLRRCVSALTSQRYPCHRYEVILILNDDQSQPSPPCVNRCPLKWLREVSPGSYAARNLGVRSAAGTVLAFTDVDCVPSPDWLMQGVQILVQNPECSFVGGKIKFFENSRSRPRTVNLYEQIVYFRQEFYVNECGFAATANMFIRRAAVDRVGLFNPTLKSGGDFEWGARARAVGLKGLYGATALVKHDHRGLQELFRKGRRVAGGLVDREKLMHQEKSSGHIFLYSDYRDEIRVFRRDLSLIESTGYVGKAQKILLSMIAIQMFVVRVVERWRVRFGAESLRA